MADEVGSTMTKSKIEIAKQSVMPAILKAGSFDSERIEIRTHWTRAATNPRSANAGLCGRGGKKRQKAAKKLQKAKHLTIHTSYYHGTKSRIIIRFNLYDIQYRNIYVDMTKNNHTQIYMILV